jgi:hypothetical protein
MGLVDSLSHPGHNATGFSDILADLGGKLVELARDVSESKASVVDYFWHTAWPDGHNRYQATALAAQAIGVEFRSIGIAGIPETDDAFASIKQKGTRTVIVQPSPFRFSGEKR